MSRLLALAPVILIACAPVPQRQVVDGPRFPEFFEPDPVLVEPIRASAPTPSRSAPTPAATPRRSPPPEPSTPPGQGLPPRGEGGCVPGGSILEPACPPGESGAAADAADAAGAAEDGSADA